jgi:bud emergence protein 1
LQPNNATNGSFNGYQAANPYDPNSQSSLQQPQPSPTNSQIQQQQLLAPLQASVPRYCFADDTFWFIVVVEMEDGRWWELQRLYQDFYDLQINLITEFPREAGNYKGVERSLPYMPGPVTYVTDNISNGRRANLTEYIRQLLKLGTHITRGYRVRKFFACREGDYEIDPNVGDPYRVSAGSQVVRDPNGSQQSFSNGSQQQLQPSALPHDSYASQPRGHTRNPSSATTQANPQTYTPPQQSAVPTSNGATTVKIKVWFGSDSIVVIRLPHDFNYADLLEKLRSRRALEPQFKNENQSTPLEVLWRDEGDGGKVYEMTNDQDLRAAQSRGERLTLEVRNIG